MAQEIERKFLIEGDLPHNLSYYCPVVQKPTHVFQGYLSIDPNYEVRINNMYHLTTKIGTGLVREEFIEDISPAAYKMLWPLTKGHRIEKTRHYYTVKGYLAELDVYHAENKGLITVEIEFPSIEQAAAFTAPAWFGPDVTDRFDLKNAQLAK